MRLTTFRAGTNSPATLVTTSRKLAQAVLHEARYTGGLWVGKFLKTVTYQKVNREGGQVVAPHAAAICDAEMMFGHAVTCRLRLDAQSRAV
jgi:hypothetical protein